MKTKRMLMFAAAAVALVACKGKSVEQKIAEFEQWDNDFQTAFEERARALHGEDEALEEYLDSAVTAYTDHVKDVLQKNKDNQLGINAVRALYGMVEADDLVEYVDQITAPLHGDDSTFFADIKMAYNAVANTAEGKMFTDFEIDGVKFSDFIGKGKYVLVDFWASWCGPCRREMPNLRAVYDEFHGDKFDMLSVAVWDDPEETAKAAEEENIVWNQIVNAQKIPTDIYGIEGIPHIILFGPDGTILKRNLRGDNIREAVKDALDD